MENVREHFVSSRRHFEHFRLIAVAFLATAFLLSGAHAAKSKRDPVAKKASVVTTEGKRKAGKASRDVSSVPKRHSVHAGGRQAVVEKRTRGGRTAHTLAAYSGKRGARPIPVVAHRPAVRFVEPSPPPRMSYGQMAGLHGATDALDLKSSVALVVDQDSREVLFSKNESAVLPIASITKLMTGLLITEARLPMDEMIVITEDDVDMEKGSRSRLSVGTMLSRGELLHLALMSSENRAAHALGRTYPGGIATFVSMMNAKARSLDMRDTRYVEPTGLSSANQSSARDLATLVNVASQDSTLRYYSTSPESLVEVGNRLVQFNTTNRLVRNPEWEIGLQKTGYISEAGQCLVMQAKVAGRKLIMVFLDSAGKFSRIADAERVKRWVEASHLMGLTPTAAVAHTVTAN